MNLNQITSTILKNKITAVVGTVVNYGNQNLAQVLQAGNDGGGSQIKNIADPTNLQDALTLAYFNNHQTGAVSSVFGRTGAVMAQTGDYSYSQISGAPTDLAFFTNSPGYLTSIAGIAAGGDLSGTYVNPTVAKINGNAIPSNASGALTNDGSGNLSWAGYWANTGTTNITSPTINGFPTFIVGTGTSGFSITDNITSGLGSHATLTFNGALGRSNSINGIINSVTFTGTAVGSAYLPIVLSSTYNSSINSMVGNNYQIRAVPTYNFTGTSNSGSLYGFYYSPIETSLNGYKHYGFVSTSTTAQNGFGVSSPTAYIHVGAGGTSQPQVILNPGTLNSSVIDGNLEYASSHIYFSIAGVRYQLDQQSGVGFANPMTTLGDLIYENATPAPTRLAGNTSTTKNFLIQTGNGTISAAPQWGTISAGDIPTLSYWPLSGSATISGNVSMTIGTNTVSFGTLGFSDTGIFMDWQSTNTSYNQIDIQNSSNAVAASSNFVVNNDQASSTTNYGEFGINSSGFTGSGAWNIAGAVYLDASTTDLSMGTLGAKPIHFFTNSSTTDRLQIDSNGLFTFNQSVQSASNTFLTFTQAAHTGGNPKFLLLTGGTLTGLTSATENIDIDINLGSRTFVDGTIATQRNGYFRGATLNKTTTSATFTEAYTFYIDPPTAGSGVTITRPRALGLGGSVQIVQAAASNPSYLITDGGGGNFFGMRMASGPAFLVGGFGGSGSSIQFADGSSGYAAFTGNGSGASFGSYAFGTTVTTNAQMYLIQGALTSSWKPAWRVTPGSHTGMATTVEYPHYVWDGSTITIASGTTAIQAFAWMKANTYAGTSGTATATVAATLQLDPTTVGTNAAITNNYTLYSNGKIGFPFTYTAIGTTGAQTINKPSGSLNIAAAGTSVVLTNNFITANSVVIPILLTNDSTAKSVSSSVSAGSVTFTLNAAATGTVAIAFIVLN